MNVTAVITTSAPLDAAAGRLPANPRAVLRSSLHIYRLYRIRIDGRFADYTFRDSTGEVLVRCNYFDDEPTARAWVAQHIRQAAESRGEA